MREVFTQDNDMRQILPDPALLTLAFRAFEHSQGNQQLQVDAIEWAVKRWRDSDVQIDLTSEERLAAHVARMRTPNGHSIVGVDEERAQFCLWWSNIWDIIRVNYSGDTVYIPTAEALRERARTLAKEHDVPSLAEEKMDHVSARMQAHLPELTAATSLTQFLVPKLVEVEYGYQVDQEYHPVRGRQRTDGGDRCESKLLTNCSSALTKLADGRPLVLFDHMYTAISAHLDTVEQGADPELGAAYEGLMAAYNTNHPLTPVERLHR